MLTYLVFSTCHITRRLDFEPSMWKFFDNRWWWNSSSRSLFALTAYWNVLNTWSKSLSLIYYLQHSAWFWVKHVKILLMMGRSETWSHDLSVNQSALIPYWTVLNIWSKSLSFIYYLQKQYIKQSKESSITWSHRHWILHFHFNSFQTYI